MATTPARESYIRTSSRKHVPFAEVWKALDLKEHHLYKVEVMAHGSNPPHTAVLFTGYSSGAYCTVYNSTYGAPINLEDMYHVKILQELGPK